MTDKKKPSGRGVMVGWFALAILFLLVVISLLFPLGSRSGRYGNGAKRADAGNGASSLVSALKAYQTEYGGMPSGDHARIIATLRGDNPKKIIFFEAAETRFSAGGEFLDPWKTPYRIGAQNPLFPWAYSCGKNRIDEGAAQTSDDIASWR